MPDDNSRCHGVTHHSVARIRIVAQSMLSRDIPFEFHFDGKIFHFKEMCSASLLRVFREIMKAEFCFLLLSCLWRDFIIYFKI